MGELVIYHGLRAWDSEFNSYLYSTSHLKYKKNLTLSFTLAYAWQCQYFEFIEKKKKKKRKNKVKKKKKKTWDLVSVGQRDLTLLFLTFMYLFSKFTLNLSNTSLALFILPFCFRFSDQLLDSVCRSFNFENMSILTCLF